MLTKYKAFLFRGNLLDLAVAFVLGLAFNAIVQALANDVVLGTIAGLFDLSSLAEVRIGPVVVGTFLGALLNFVIVATVLFVVIQAAERFQRDEPAAAEPTPVPSDEVVLLREIRDALQASRGGAG